MADKKAKADQAKAEQNKQVAESQKSAPVASETKPAETSTSQAQTTPQTASMSVSAFQSAGRVTFNGLQFTYYNLDMSGVASREGISITTDGQGLKRTPDGLLVLAYGMGEHKGEIIQTPLGAGIVLDGCPTAGTVDIAVGF